MAGNRALSFDSGKEGEKWQEVETANTVEGLARFP